MDIALTPEPKPLQTPLTIQPSPKISPCNLIALSCGLLSCFQSEAAQSYPMRLWATKAKICSHLLSREMIMYQLNNLFININR